MDDRDPITTLREVASFRLNALDMTAIHKRYCRTLTNYVRDLDTMGLIDRRQIDAVDELLRRIDQFLADKREAVCKAGI